MQFIKKILFLLSPNERRQAVFLLIMVLITALLDMIGVASILPFMAVLSNPEIIETNILLNEIYKISQIFGVKNNQEFLISLGILVFFLLVFTLFFKALTTYVQVRFVLMREFSIGKRMVESYLHQPYSWFLSRHSADLGKTILSEVSQIIGNGIRPLMDLIAKGMVAIAIITLLILANPKLALVASLTLGGTYSIIFLFTKRFLNKSGEERLKNNQLRFTAVVEAFSAAKEVKVGGLEEIYVRRFSSPAKNFAQNQASATVIGQLPRFVLEAVAFGGIILVILYLMIKSGSFNNALPIISLYVFAGYRLMPALQGIYYALTQIAFVGPSLDKTYKDLKDLNKTNLIQDQTIQSFNESIDLKNINYNYPNTEKKMLKNISLSIKAKTTIGIVGATGSGKTTTVDIILGLLEPQEGTLEVDGNVITKNNLRSWQSLIGYVPQHIYLADDTIAANIAFGKVSKNIDFQNIEKTAKIANLHQFVIDELPKKYETIIGERGVRLSGGQRQRIGIARALYHNPKLLILDEGTSALDNYTEKAVMDAVNNLPKEMTIVIITHHLNTVKNCDVIFKLDNGKLIGRGTFDELINNNKKFRLH